MHPIRKSTSVLPILQPSPTIERAASTEIIIRQNDGKRKTYKLTKFQRSNQSNCYNQRPIVTKGDVVKAGDVIADGPSTSNGEMALGKNPLIGFMTWEGYNYEDAVLLSERLVPVSYTHLAAVIWQETILEVTVLHQMVIRS